MIRFATTAFALSLTAASAFAAPVTYEFDKSHSNLLFNYNHAGYSVTDGRIGEWDATLVIDADDPTASTVEFVFKADSIDTFWGPRDEHIKGADFFDVANYPEVTFKSTEVKQTGDNQLEVTGDLTIKDVTEPAVLTVDVLAFGEHPMAKTQAAGFYATTTVKRSDFGMDKYTPIVGDDVSIIFSGEAEVVE